MNKYYIQINENRNGLYDFIIELLNEEHMSEKATLGVRENIDTLSECATMIETFPLSSTSELSEIVFNRRNKYIKLNKLEQLFIDDINDIIQRRNLGEFIIN